MTPLSSLVKAGSVGDTHCSIAGCDRRILARGMCGRHYQRWYKKGDALAPTQDREVVHGDPVAAFWGKVDQSAGVFGCWLWQGATNADGYGYINVGANRMVATHRFAYELLVGAIPDGLFLDHVRERGCRSKACCNPAHLEPVTNQVNQQRAWTPDAIAERRARAVV